jgi:hypothetical protein
MEFAVVCGAGGLVMTAEEQLSEIENGWQNPGSHEINGNTLLRLSWEPKEEIRLRVAWLAGRIVRPELELIESILVNLVNDLSPAVCLTARESLHRLLLRSCPAIRSRIALEWSASRDSFVRQAIAVALGDPQISFMGETAVLEHLANDPLSTVRQATAFAAGAKLRSRPSTCFKVLGRLSTDKKRKVRFRAIESLATALAQDPAPDVIRQLVPHAISSDSWDSHAG